ncbi:hypothetical protein T484DRAFT_1922583 [Baffinella frigidus]|nr:hypothetical protein T484DRAFT_1922583 [Cryptophyta sp. CCMP2293]
MPPYAALDSLTRRVMLKPKPAPPPPPPAPPKGPAGGKAGAGAPPAGAGADAGAGAGADAPPNVEEVPPAGDAKMDEAPRVVEDSEEDGPLKDLKSKHKAGVAKRQKAEDERERAREEAGDDDMVDLERMD